jgi:dephospho-CoA kinase
MNPPTLRVGLTGGIGSGKSTVAAFLGHRGAAVIDADAISRNITAPGGTAIDAIRIEFGSQFIDAEGAMDRNAMRSLAYADSGARKRLEAIIHPLVGLEAHQQASQAITDGACCVVLDIPLLVESVYWRRVVDSVLVVDCTPEVQIERVMSRSALSREAVEKIITSQANRENRLKAADHVIFNVRLSLEQLAAEVKQLSHRFGL